MKHEGQITARKGILKLKVKLEQPMENDKYHISLSILEPKRDELLAPVYIEIPTKNKNEFVVHFREKTVEKLSLVYIVES